MANLFQDQLNNLFTEKKQSDAPAESPLERARRIRNEMAAANQVKQEAQATEDRGWLDTARSYYDATARAYDLADNQMNVGRLAYKVMSGTASPTEKRKLGELELKSQEIQSSIESDPYVAKAFGTIAPYIVESAKQGGKGALTGAMIGGGAAALLGNVLPGAVAMPEEALTIPAGAIVGAKIGGMFSSLENMRQIEAGQAYMQMRKEGISHPVSRVFAELYGGASTGLEAAQFKLLGKLIPGGDQIGQKILQSATSKWLTTIGKKSGAQAAGRLATTAAGEAAIESGQQVTQNFMEILAKETNDALKNTNLSEEHRENFFGALSKEVADTFLLTLTGMGIAGVPGAAVNVALPGQKKPVMSKEVLDDVDKIIGRDARQGSLDALAMQEANQAIIDKTMPEEPPAPPRRMTAEERQREFLPRQEYTSAGSQVGSQGLGETPATQQEIINRIIPEIPPEAVQAMSPEQRQALIDRLGQDAAGVGSSMGGTTALPPPSPVGPRPFQLEAPAWKVTPEGQAINPVPPEVDAALSPPAQLTGVDYRVTPEGQAVPISEAQGSTIATEGMQQVVQPQQAASLPSQPAPKTPSIETTAPVQTSVEPNAPPIPSATNELMDVQGVQQAQIYSPTAFDEVGNPTDAVPVVVDPNKMPYMPPRTKSGTLQMRGLKQKLTIPAAVLRDGTVVEGTKISPVVWSKPTEADSVAWSASIQAIKDKIGPDWKGKVAWIKDLETIDPKTGQPRMVPMLGFKLPTLSNAPNPSLPTFISNVQLVNEGGMEKSFLKQGKRVVQRAENKARVARPLSENQRKLIMDNRDWLGRVAKRVTSQIANRRQDIDPADISSAVNEAIVKAAKSYNVTEEGNEVAYKTKDTRNAQFRKTVGTRLKDYAQKIAIKDKYGSNRLANERRRMQGEMPAITDDEGNVVENIPEGTEFSPPTKPEPPTLATPPPVKQYTGQAAQAYAQKKGIPTSIKVPVRGPKQVSTATPTVHQDKFKLSAANVGERIIPSKKSKFEAIIRGPSGNVVIQHKNEGTLEEFKKSIPVETDTPVSITLTQSVTGLPSNEHRIMSVDEPTTGKLQTSSSVADILGNQRGSSVILNTASSKAVEAIQSSAQAAEKFANVFDVERQWKKKGMPEIGFTIKNIFSRRDLEEKVGMENTRKLYDVMRKDFGGSISREDQTKVLLAYEDPAYLAKQDTAWQERARRSIDWMKEYFTGKQKDMQSRGLQLDFMKRMEAFYRDRASITKSETKRQQYLDMADRAANLNFAHLPAQMVFEHKMREHVDATTDADREKFAAQLKSILEKRRETLTIASLFEPDKGGESVLKMGDITPADVVLSYAWRMGQDHAILDIRDAIEKYGGKLYRVSRKDPTSEDGMFWQRAPRTMPILDTLIPNDKRDGKHNVYLRQDFLKEFTDALKYSSTPGTAWDQAAAWVKTAQFYNPIIMPMYNLVQLAGAGIMPQDWKFSQAIQDVGGWEAVLKGTGYGTKSPAYLEAAKHGLMSQPFNNPFFKMKSMAQFMSREKGGVEGAVRGLVDSFLSEHSSIRDRTPFGLKWTAIPRALTPMVYGAASHVAWTMDEVTRMIAYNHLRKQGHSPRDAAQLAAKFLGDYAGVPAKTRHSLNKVLFTPTYFVSMTKLLGGMTGEVIKTAVNPDAIKSFATKDPKYKVQRRMVYAALGTLAVNLGFKMFMTSLGGEEEVAGRTYSFMVDTAEGPKKLTYTWTVPANLPQKWFTRFMKVAFPDATDQRNLFKRAMDNIILPEIHPAIARPAELINNQTRAGQTIMNEFASADEKMEAFVNWLGDTTFPLLTRGVLEGTGLREHRDKAADYYIKHHGHVMNNVVDTLAFKYMKDPDMVKTAKQMKAMSRRFDRAMTQEFRETGRINQEWVDNYKKKIKEASKTLTERK